MELRSGKSVWPVTQTVVTASTATPPVTSVSVSPVMMSTPGMPTPRSMTPGSVPRMLRPFLAAGFSPDVSMQPSKTDSSQENLYAKFLHLGQGMGLSGTGLSQFVLNGVQQEKERQERVLEREAERLERERELQRREAKEERERQEREAKEERERKERRLERETERQEREQERVEFQHTLQQVIAARTSTADGFLGSESLDTSRREEKGNYKLKIEPFDDKEDIDFYLRHFEKIAASHGWPRTTWAIRLSPLLKGAAREAFLQLDPTDALDFDKLKTALLYRFQRTPEFYRKKFRETRKESSESFEQFLKRLRMLVERWIGLAEKDVKNAEEVLDMFLQEQLYASLHTELELRVRERQPKTAEETAKVAHQLVEARQATRSASKSVLPPKQQQSHRDNRNSRTSATGAGEKKKKDPKDIVCYRCKKKGHYQSDCKEAKVNAVKLVQPARTTSPLCRECEDQEYDPVVQVQLNGRSAVGLRDTGANTIMVVRDLVPEEDLTSRMVTIALADPRQQMSVPTALVVLDSPFVKGRVEALVMESLCQDVIIGNVATFSNGESVPVPVYPKRELLQAVQTRGQARRVNEKSQIPVTQVSGLDVTPQELADLQKEDATLARARQAADHGGLLPTGKNQVVYEYSKGILRRKFRDQKGDHSQVCVPKKLRNEVLKLAHDTPMAGHLAAKKTRERIWSEFYWPGMCSDIRRYCQSCDQCQKVTPRGRVAKVPLGRLPLMDLPFQRVAVDLVGPMIPASDRGNRFILVMVDYATRYPEAVPLRSIDTEHVAEALWEMWSRLGIPQEVLSDRGTQFTSEAMKEVHRLLAIKGTTTTPYHAQCNGLVERFNATLKAMLRKLCLEKPRT